MQKFDDTVKEMESQVKELEDDLAEKVEKLDEEGKEKAKALVEKTEEAIRSSIEKVKGIINDVQEDEKRHAAELRNDDREERVDPAEFLEHDVLGNQQDLLRQQHGGHHDGEENLRSLEGNTGKPERHQG